MAREQLIRIYQAYGLRKGIFVTGSSTLLSDAFIVQKRIISCIENVSSIESCRGLRMALIIESMRNISNLVNKYEDPRTANWPLMSSPIYTIGIVLTYIYGVKVLGPKLMKHRKPFQLKWALIAYNLFQVVLNAWLWYMAATSGWLNGYSFKCQPIDYSDHPHATTMVQMTWWYYMSKFTDFLDTVFFIMRKKNDQITTLHVIHHGIMPMTSWICVKFAPNGHGTFVGFVNTFVHVIMYLYYLLSAFGPKVQKYLWWKKYITTIQMIQFIMLLMHSFPLLFIECDFPSFFTWLVLFKSVLFFFLFKQFYNQAYLKKNSVVNHFEKNTVFTNNTCREESKGNGFKIKNNFDVKYKGKYIN